MTTLGHVAYKLGDGNTVTSHGDHVPRIVVDTALEELRNEATNIYLMAPARYERAKKALELGSQSGNDEARRLLDEIEHDNAKAHQLTALAARLQARFAPRPA